MTTVERLIGDLLLRHNCVIIPSFGGFVAKPVSAQIDYEKGTMTPPGKSLLFNRQLINNDGLLINELSQSNSISFDQAASIMDEKVAEWNQALKTGGRIEIDRVGNLFYDDERNICFEQDRFFNLLLESFGLGKVHFLTEEDVQIVEHKIEVERTVQIEAPKPVAADPVDAKPKAVEPKVEVETPVISIQAPKLKKKEKEESNVVEHPAARKRRPWRYVAVACVLPLAFYSIWIPMKTDVLESGIISVHDFNPFHKSSEGSYVKEEFTKEITINTAEIESLAEEIQALDPEKKHYSYEFAEETYIQVSLPEKETSDVVDSVEPLNETQEVISANEMNYIVGCFGDKSNAENLVAKLKANGMDARIYDNNNGLHRVTAGSAISLESYHEIKAQADGLGLSGWKLK